MKDQDFGIVPDVGLAIAAPSIRERDGAIPNVGRKDYDEAER